MHGTSKDRAQDCVVAYQGKKIFLACLRGLLLLALTVTSSVRAGEFPTLKGCEIADPLSVLRESTPMMSLEPGQVYVSATEAELINPGTSVLWGGIFLQSDGHRLYSDSVRFDSVNEQVTASGGVRYLGKDMDILARSVTLDAKNKKSRFHHAKFFLREQAGRGKARKGEIAEDGISHFSSVSYTACPPGKNDWLIRAESMRIDQKNNQGIARNASLRIRDVPVIYLPVMTFPVTQDRTSGLLAPKFATSNYRGSEIIAPYYWNIAPNQDATISGRWMEKRGEQLQTEYRFLTRSSQGKLYGEYLDSDTVTGDSRSFASFEGETHLSKNWSLSADAARVTDSFYFQDLGNALSISSIRSLEQRGDVRYDSENLSGLLRVQSFQVVDPLQTQPDPYQRLPQLRLDTRNPTWVKNLVAWDLRSEVVRFSQAEQWQGDRVDIEPGLGIPLIRPAYSIYPRWAYRYTSYNLAESTGLEDDYRERGLPIGSVDARLFMERDITLRQQGWVQTLEPRLYYLYVPVRTQDDLPVFDTKPMELDGFSLFSENKFTGPDRIADADQVSAALTSRFLDAENGSEVAALNIGQIYRFEEQAVVFPGQAVDERKYSDIFGQMDVNLNQRISSHIQLQWEPQQGFMTKYAAGMRYHTGNGRLLGASYRHRNDFLEPIEQLDLVAAWPLTERWRSVGRWNRSLEDDRDVETLVGLQYQSCCWAISLARHDYIARATGKENTAIILQVELKGLSSFGNGLEEMLNRGAIGY